MSVKNGFVKLTAPDDGLQLVVRLGDGSPTFAGGVGGWEAVARPGRRPLTVWRGTNELTLTLPILFDGFGIDRQHPQGYSQEASIRTLERMGGLDTGDPEPPILHLEGALPPDDGRNPGDRWVLSGIDWGDALRRQDGHRVRAAATVTLLRFTQDDRLARVKRGSPRPTYRVVRSRPGDTFEKIAARELKMKRAGSRLARLNGKRSPDTVLPKNTRVRLPSSDALKTWKHELGG